MAEGAGGGKGRGRDESASVGSIRGAGRTCAHGPQQLLTYCRGVTAAILIVYFYVAVLICQGLAFFSPLNGCSTVSAGPDGGDLLQNGWWISNSYRRFSVATWPTIEVQKLWLE